MSSLRCRGFATWLAMATVSVSLAPAVVHVGSGISVDSSGRVYFADTIRNVVWRIEVDGSLARVAENVHTNVLHVTDDQPIHYPPDGYPREPFSYIAYGPGRQAYATVRNSVVRLLSNDSWETVAGDSLSGYRDGPAGSALFKTPIGLAVSEGGEIYVADYGNRRIRLIEASGEVSTLARTRWPWFPVGIALWGDRVYVLERWGNYFSGPPVIGPMAGLVGHPRVTVIYPDGRREVVAAVTDTWTRVVFYSFVVALFTLLAVRLRRAFPNRMRPDPVPTSES